MPDRYNEGVVEGLRLAAEVANAEYVRRDIEAEYAGDNDGSPDELIIQAKVLLLAQSAKTVTDAIESLIRERTAQK